MRPVTLLTNSVEDDRSTGAKNTDFTVNLARVFSPRPDALSLLKCNAAQIEESPRFYHGFNVQPLAS